MNKLIIVVIIISCGLFSGCSGSNGTETALREENAGLKEQIKQLTASQANPRLIEGRIRHTVAFSLKYNADAPEAIKFLQDGKRILSAIPVVENFEALKQVSPKNEFQFGFSMEFANAAAYKAYNEHPEHVKFVKERWDTEVAKFLEADFEDALP